MSTTDGIDVVAGGPPDRDAAPRPSWRWRSASLVAAGVAVGLLAGWAVGPVGPRDPGDRAPAGPAPAAGVTVPQVVDAVTLPGTGQQTVVTVPAPGSDEPRYDYSIAEAIWLAPDGTVRSGPPGCTLPVSAVQHLQVAVVHARAVAGGPNWDTVVWYRCATPRG